MKSKDELRDLDVNYLFHPTIVLEEHQKSGPHIWEIVSESYTSTSRWAMFARRA